MLRLPEPADFYQSLLLKIPSLVLVVYCCNQNGIDEDEQIKGIQLSVIFVHIAYEGLPRPDKTLLFLRESQAEQYCGGESDKVAGQPF